MSNTANLINLVVTGASSVLVVASAYKLLVSETKETKSISQSIYNEDSSNETKEDSSNETKEDPDSTEEIILPTKIGVSFEDVIAYENAKEDLQEYIRYFENHDVFQSIGGSISKGCILIGPTGTGKTLLAKALGGQANVPLYEMTYSSYDFYCNGKKMEVADLFKTIKKQNSCIVLMDDLDSEYGSMSSSINEFLFEMDQCDVNDGIVFLATAISKDSILKQFLKPGRFDKIINISEPNTLESKAIFEFYLSKIKHDDSINADTLSRYFPTKTGKDIKNLLMQAANKTVMNDKTSVSMQVIEEMIDQCDDGAEVKSIERGQKCKEKTAYHEAGHALIRYYLSAIDIPVVKPVYKATIIHRGRCTGSVSTLTNDTKYYKDKAEMLGEIEVKLGGRAAEEFVFGKDKIGTGEY